MALQARGLAEILRGGKMRISGQGETATISLDQPVLDGETVRLTATFGPADANFEWARREVLTAEGIVLDLVEEDMGRKVEPMTWTVEAQLVVKGG